MKQRTLIYSMFCFLFYGCASTGTENDSWSRESFTEEQLKADEKECDKFVKRILVPGAESSSRKTRYADIHILSKDRIENVGIGKNRRLVKNWCMENRGYKKQDVQKNR